MVQMPRRRQRPSTQRPSAVAHCVSPAHGRGSQQPDAPQTSSGPQLVAVQAALQKQPQRIPPSSQEGIAPQRG
jgi:hypothetical protein